MQVQACLIVLWFVCFEVAGQICCDTVECNDFKSQIECAPRGSYISSLCEWNGSACLERTSCKGLPEESSQMGKLEGCLSIEWFYGIRCSLNNGECEISKLCEEYNSKQSCDAVSNCSWTNDACRTTPCEDRRTEVECGHHFYDCTWIGDFEDENGQCMNVTCSNYDSETDCDDLFFDDCVWINGACRTRSCRNYDSTTCDGKMSVYVNGEYLTGYCKMTEGIYGTCELTTSCSAWTGEGKSICESKSFWDSFGDNDTHCYYTTDGLCRNPTCADYSNKDTNSEQYCNDIGCKYSPSLGTCTAVNSCSDWSQAGSDYCERHRYNRTWCIYEADGTCIPMCSSPTHCETFGGCFYVDNKSCPPCFVNCQWDYDCLSCPLDLDSDADSDSDSDSDSYRDSALTVTFSTLTVVLLLLLL